MKKPLEMTDVAGPRPEYFIGPAQPTGPFGNIATYNTPKRGSPDRVWIIRIFACHHRRFELLNLATFYMN